MAITSKLINKNKTLVVHNQQENERILTSSRENRSNDYSTSVTQPTSDPEKNFIRPLSTFRIPKIKKITTDAPTEPPIDVKIEIKNENTTAKHQLNNGLNCSENIRKHSYDHFKKRKRLAPNGTIQTSSVNLKNPSSAILNYNYSITTPAIERKTHDSTLKSNLSKSGFQYESKKVVTWADNNNQSLLEIFIFEKDDSDIRNSGAIEYDADMSETKIENFSGNNLRKQENLQHMNSFDKLKLNSLPNLIPILLPDEIVKLKARTEKRISEENYEGSLSSIYFSSPSASSTLNEMNEDHIGTNIFEQYQPKLIPFDDLSMEINEMTTNLPSTTTSPEVTNILNQAKTNLLSQNSEALLRNNLSSEFSIPQTNVPASSSVISTNLLVNYVTQFQQAFLSQLIENARFLVRSPTPIMNNSISPIIPNISTNVPTRFVPSSRQHSTKFYIKHNLQRSQRNIKQQHIHRRPYKNNRFIRN